MKIVGIMAAHQRPDITLVTLRMLRQRQQLPFHQIVVAGGPEEEKVAKAAGCDFLQVPNEPLGRKYQCGIFWSRMYDPDAVTILGSDTWLSPAWTRQTANLIGQAAECCGKLDWYTCRVQPEETVEILHYSYNPRIRMEFVGGGRTFARSLLDRLGWDLFSPAAPRNLDHYAISRVRAVGGRMAPMSDEITVLGIKGPWFTLNSFEKLNKSQRLVDMGSVPDPAAWVNSVFPGGREALMRLVPSAVWRA